MSQLFRVIALAIATAATHNALAEVTVVGTDNLDRVYACNSPNITARIHELRTEKSEGWVAESTSLEEQGKCVGYSRGSRLEIVSESTISTDHGTYDVTLVSDVAKRFPDLYVLRKNVVAFTPEELAARESQKCGNETGGEVRRVVAQPDGTLKLKRFMVTTRCVDGKMRSFSKPLN